VFVRRRYALEQRRKCLVCTVAVLNSGSVRSSNAVGHGAQGHGWYCNCVLDYGTSEGSASSILRVRFVPETQTGGGGVKRGLGVGSGEICFGGTRPVFDVGGCCDCEVAILDASGGENKAVQYGSIELLLYHVSRLL
jgi:hypothetical protein